MIFGWYVSAGLQAISRWMIGTPTGNLLFVMHRPLPEDKPNRFKGSLRYYHRSSPQSQESDSLWTDGRFSKSRLSKLLKMLGILLAVLGLAAIIAGLVIELR